MRYFHVLLFVAALLLIVDQRPAFAEPQGSSRLYLVTGQATWDEAFHAESTILGVDASQTALVPAASLANATAGSEFIIADHERRLVVSTGPADDPKILTVLNMDEPTDPRTIPFMQDGSILQTFLCASGGKVFAALWSFQSSPAGPAGLTSQLIGIDLASGNTSQRILAQNDCGEERSEGDWQPGDFNPFLDVYFRNGRFLRDSKLSASDIGVAPPAGFAAADSDRFILEINNDEMLVIARFSLIASNAVPTNNILFIYDKKKGRWRNRNIGTDGAGVRGFGSWIATTHSEVKRKVVNGRVSQPNPSERESPGSAFRRNVVNPTSSDKFRVTIDSRFQFSPYYFSGDLTLYNIDSQREYTIKTGQGDSEILLVDGNTVYYRVNDTLYQAQIGQTKIGDPQLILQDDRVQLAHWAFIGPSQTK